MKVKIIHDKNEISDFYSSRTKYDYMYQYNNLDRREWSNTICYGLYDKGELQQIAMLYIGYETPVLLAASFDKIKYNKELIKRIKNYLPSEFYTHMDKETLEYAFDKFEMEDLHEYINMGIDKSVDISRLDRNKTSTLNISYSEKINKLFNDNYPENYLDENLLELNDCYGILENNKLISFAGVHAYSLEYKIASVAHVTTDKKYRSKGYARDSIVALLKDLRSKVDYIGLNVMTSNTAAIKCYEHIGFKEYGKYIACDIKLNAF
ncbi:MAG: GNAT family N-acetyltransferase [Acidaminobacteraceae bacterium]